MLLLLAWICLLCTTGVRSIDHIPRVWSDEIKTLLKSPAAPVLPRPSVMLDIINKCSKDRKFTVRDSVRHAAFLLDEPQLCLHQEVSLLFAIHSAPSNRENRDLIRSTWASLKQQRSITFRHLFFLGAVEREEEQQAIEEESKAFRDIVQRDFADSYHNLTLKHITVLEWVITRSCANVGSIIKLDDDIMVDTFRLAHMLELIPEFVPKAAFRCTSTHGARPVRRARGRLGKWRTTRSEFSKRVYPPYCEGLAYMTTPAVMRKLYFCSLFTPYFWIDDVYVTGILAEQLDIPREGFTKVNGYDTFSESYGKVSFNAIFYVMKEAAFMKNALNIWHQIVGHTALS